MADELSKKESGFNRKTARALAGKPFGEVRKSFWAGSPPLRRKKKKKKKKSPIDGAVNLCKVYEKIRVRIRKKFASGISTSLPVSS